MYQCQKGRSLKATPRPATLRCMAEIRQFKGRPGNAQSDNTIAGKVSHGVFAALLLMGSGLVQAGLAPQFHFWKAAPSGTVTESGVKYDIEDDLHMKAESIIGGGIEWGDLFGRFQNLNFTGTGEITVDTTLLGIPIFSQTASVTSRVDFDDWTAGWTPLNWKILRLGVAVKHLSGILDAQEQDTIGSYKVDETFPLVVLGATLPFGDTGIQIAADGMWISQGDNTVYEYQLGLERVGAGLQAALGYRRQRYDIRDGDEALDAKVDGLFASVGWGF